jgi:hypothetical protein
MLYLQTGFHPWTQIPSRLELRDLLFFCFAEPFLAGQVFRFHSLFWVLRFAGSRSVLFPFFWIDSRVSLAEHDFSFGLVLLLFSYGVIFSHRFRVAQSSFCFFTWFLCTDRAAGSSDFPLPLLQLGGDPAAHARPRA